VTPGNSNTIYTVGTGVSKSGDGGETWSLASDGIAAIQPQHIAVSPHDRESILTMAGTDGAFGSHNSGNEWVTHLISRGGRMLRSSRPFARYSCRSLCGVIPKVPFARPTE